MLVLLLNSLLIGLSSYFLTRRFFSKLGFTDFLLYFFTFFLSQIILIELVLGIVGRLFAPEIILLEFIFLLFSYAAYLIRKPAAASYAPDLKFIFENRIVLLAVSVFFVFYIIKLWFNLISPPLCPDSLQYHLSFPATWLQNGNLNNPIVVFGFQPTSAELSALSYYPIHSELLFFWLMFPLKNAFLADAAEAPFYLIGILAVYSILRKFNLKKETAFLSGMLWVLIPNVFKQLKTASQVDVICAVLFLVALNSLIILGREFNIKNSCFFGLTLGLLFGTKLLNLYWAVALLPLFAYYLWVNYPKNRAGRLLVSLAAVVSAAFLLGGFSYIRTFLLTGNPFYPVKIIFFGRELFPGFIDKDTFSNLFVRWRDFKLAKMFFSEGLGAQFILFILPATFVPLLALPFIRKRYKFSGEAVVLFFIPVTMFFLYFFVIRAYWVRYIFAYLGPGMIAAFLFLDRFKWSKKYITIFGFACIFSSAAELAHRQELAISLITSAVVFTILLILQRRIALHYSRLLHWKTLVLLAAALFGCLYFLNERYDREKFMRYVISAKGKKGTVQKEFASAWQWLNQDTAGGRRIAYTGRSEFYPLFGTRLKNRVFYISTNNKPSLPHYYGDGLYRREKDFDAWRENLRMEKIDYLFVALPIDANNESSNKSEFPIEDRWAREHPESFKEVFRNPLVHIYTVSR